MKSMSFIGEYLKYTEYSYNGHHWFDMMRAIRNLYVHKYDTKVNGYNKLSQDDKVKVKQMQSRIRKLIAEGYLEYWIEKFPDLLFVAYNHAIENYKTYIKLPGTVEDCNLRRHFIEKFYVGENAKMSKIPVRLEDVVTSFYKFSADEAKNTSGLLLHSINIVGGPHVHFMKYPTSKFLGGIYTPNEIVVMTLSLDNSTGARNLTCEIDRKLNTTGENRILVGFNLKRFKQDTLKPKSTITFKQTAVHNLSSDVINALYIFTDDIMCALLYQKMYLSARNFQQIFIYTNKTFREVREISKNVLEQLDQNFVPVELCWNDLNNEYKKELFKKPFLVQTNSKSRLELSKIHNTVNSINDISESKLLELMHDTSPALLSTGIPTNFNSKKFYGRFLESTNGDLDNDITIKHNLLSRKTVTLIYASACMGKSWLLSSIGRYLEEQNQLVTFQNATDLVKKLKKNEMYDIRVIIEKLWRSSKLEQDIVMHQNSLNKVLYVLIDGFSDLMNNKEINLLSLFIENSVQIPNIKFVVTSSSEMDVESDWFRTSVKFKLEPIDIDGFIAHFFNDVAKTSPTNRNSRIDSLKEKYKLQCKNLGNLIETPFVCSVWCSAMKKYVELGKPLKRHNPLTITQIHSDLVNQQLKNYYPSYHHYVNKTVLMWPYLIKSFKKQFPDSTPDLSKFKYFTDLFGDRISSSSLPMSDFLQGTVNDYLVAYLIEKIIGLTDAGPLGTKMCQQFWLVLQVDPEDKKFVYGNIVEFLNRMSSEEMVAQVVKLSADDIDYSQVHDILSFALKCKYDQLFESILNVIDPHKLDPNHMKLKPEDKIFAIGIFRKACETNDYTVVDNLVTLDCVKWDYEEADGLTCLKYVDMHISDEIKKDELTGGINAWLNLTN